MAFYHALRTYENDPDYPDKAAWIADHLLELRKELFVSIQADRTPGTLIIGSWNIRAFDEGKPRMDESYHYIAEIIDKFDICAVQEIKSDLGPLRRLVKLLGPNWTISSPMSPMAAPETANAWPFFIIPTGCFSAA